MRLTTLRAHHVWAGGGARAQARRSIGDILGGCLLQKNLEAFGAIPGKGKGRRTWVAFRVVVVHDGQNSMTAAKNVGMCVLCVLCGTGGGEKGAEALEILATRGPPPIQ